MMDHLSLSFLLFSDAAEGAAARGDAYVAGTLKDMLPRWSFFGRAAEGLLELLLVGLFCSVSWCTSWPPDSHWRVRNDSVTFPGAAFDASRDW